jgi:hypothetical protein
LSASTDEEEVVVVNTLMNGYFVFTSPLAAESFISGLPEREQRLAESFKTGVFNNSSEAVRYMRKKSKKGEESDS